MYFLRDLPARRRKIERDIIIGRARSNDGPASTIRLFAQEVPENKWDLLLCELENFLSAGEFPCILRMAQYKELGSPVANILNVPSLQTGTSLGGEDRFEPRTIERRTSIAETIIPRELRLIEVRGPEIPRATHDSKKFPRHRRQKK